MKKHDKGEFGISMFAALIMQLMLKGSSILDLTKLGGTLPLWSSRTSDTQ